MIEQLIARVFKTRNAVHFAHWKTDSYAQHMALGALYDDLPDLIDAIVEAWQGAKGIRIGEIPTNGPDPRPDMILSHLTQEAEWIAANRAKIAAGVPPIENMLDELAEAYLSAAYKLRFLK